MSYQIRLATSADHAMITFLLTHCGMVAPVFDAPSFWYVAVDDSDVIHGVIGAEFGGLCKTNGGHDKQCILCCVDHASGLGQGVTVEDDGIRSIVDERYLHFGRRPEERTTPRDERWPRQSDDRLRICDRERCRRERCAGERQQRAHGLHGAEVQEHEWCAHEERRQRSGDRGTGQFTEDSDEWRRGMSAFVAR